MAGSRPGTRATGIVVVAILATGALATAAGAAEGPRVTELSLTGVASALVAGLPAPAAVEPDERATPPSASQGRRFAPASPPTPPAPPADPDVLTGELSTAAFSVFGVTWDRGADLDGVVVRYRVRTGGTWSAWEAVAATDVAPDPGTPDARASHRDGTDPIVAMDGDGIQIWAEADSGTVRNLKAVLVDPGSEPARAPTVSRTANRAVVATDGAALQVAVPGQPAILSRADWGADESMRTCVPDYSRAMLSAAVHHTASSNGYDAAAVPGLIRGFYAYHTRPESAGGRGWCDIGYNFLVDRFGRIWEGRAGGITSTVVGVHTGGFNSRTIGVAAIGDYAQENPSAELVDGISRLIAWKFAVHGITAGTAVTMVSGGGASLYPEGTVVTFPTIYGHRDAQQTTCPGQYLYDLLPAIRARVADLTNASVAVSPHGSLDSVAGTAAGIAVAGWAFDPDSADSLRIDVSVDGVVTPLLAASPRPDVAALFGIGPMHGFGATVPAGRGQHVVCVSAANVADGRDIVLGCSLATVANATPIGALDLARAVGGVLEVGGWALDPDTSDPIDVHVYVDGVPTAVRADGYRPDVDSVYHLGQRHGFGAWIPIGEGDHQVCVYLINLPGGVNPLLGCRTLSAANPTPFGSLDIARSARGSIEVGGWALDPDTTDAVDIHVYVDGTPTAIRADGYRPDVAALYGLGASHGFLVAIPAGEGTHQVCVYPINRPVGTNPLLGCRSVMVSNPTPFGSLDLARGVAGTVQVGGWALDPDTSEPIDVHVYVDGTPTAIRADGDRPDVAAAYGMGSAHGFLAVVPAGAGAHQVCVYLINRPAGTNPLLGCRVVAT